MASIEVLFNGQKQQTRSFEGDRLLIGREPTCNLQLNHPSVSRQHCVIVRKGDVFVLQDLRSSNGTFVNGRKVSGTFYLNNGDDLQVGEYTLRFLFESAPSQAAPEFEPTMLVQNKEAQEALRKGIPPPEIAAPAAKASAPAMPPAAPAIPAARPSSAIVPVAPTPVVAPIAQPVVPVAAKPPVAPVIPVAAVPPVVPITPMVQPVSTPPPSVAPPKSPATEKPRQDLAAPGKFDDPFDVPTLRPPPIEVEPPKPTSRPLPPPIPKATAAQAAPAIPPPLPAGRPPSSPRMPPPLPVAQPSPAAGMPVMPPPLPPLAPDDPRAAMTMLPPAPPMPSPPHMTPPPLLSPDDPRAALTILPPVPPVPTAPPARAPIVTPAMGAPTFQTPHGISSAGGLLAGPIAYAGFFTRFAAMVIDGIIFSIPFVLVIVPLAILAGNRQSVALAVVTSLLSLLMSVCMCVLLAKMESGPHMATFGKRIMGIQVVDLNGQRISFMRALGRLFAKIPSSFLYIGFIMAAFTEKKQALHDILAGCLVIQKRS
jgi:pSer/pThr/pTyr-binding forkhead associated (FHA) protein/uncharacterized RDD family membrane protein YckC